MHAMTQKITPAHAPFSPVLNTTSTSLIKAFSFVFCAMLATLALFWLMSYLVKQDVREVTESVPYVPLTVVLEERDEKPKVIEKLPEPPPIKPQPPRMETPSNTDPSDGIPEYNPGHPVIEPINNGTNLTVFDGTGDARPIVRIEPRYPVEAARNGTEGWVRLRFSISAMGTVENIEIIDAEPKRIFDREASRALRKWKYKPKVVDGKAVAQHNMNVELTFSLTQQ